MIFSRQAVLFMRSFFIQSFWNREGFQNIGFAYMIMPAIRDIYKDNTEKFLSVMKRHLEHFVTNPYLSGAVAALVIYREEELKRDGKIDAQEISTFKRYVSSSFAAIGDSVIWGCLRPINSVFGTLAFFLFADGLNVQIIAVSVLIYLLFYNVTALSIRYWSASLAVRYKMQFIVVLKKLPVSAVRNTLCFAGLFACVFAAVFYILNYGGGAREKLAALVFTVVFLTLKIMNISTAVIFILGLSGSFVIGSLGL